VKTSWKLVVYLRSKVETWLHSTSKSLHGEYSTTLLVDCALTALCPWLETLILEGGLIFVFDRKQQQI